MNPTETARMIGYLAGLALGLFFAVYGALTGDTALIGAGLALVGVGGTAGGVLAKQVGKHGKV